MTAGAPAPGTVEVLYRAVSDDLRRYLLARTGDAALADDLVHDAFLRLHARADGLADVAHLRGFVFQVVRRTLIDHQRQQATRARALAAVGDAPAEASPEALDRVDRDDPLGEPSPEATMARVVGAFIDTLPPADREALRLVEFDGLNQRQLAERLGLSPSGARSRVQRARRRLADALRACCALEVDRYGRILEMRCRSCEPAACD